MTVSVIAAPDDHKVSPSDCAQIFRPGGFEDPFDAEYATCPDDQGKVALVSGVTREINGIPDEEMKGLFEDKASFCGDLFEQGRFDQAMKAIVKRDHLSGGEPAARRAMHVVFGATRMAWNNFDPPLVDGYTIYGCTELNALTTPAKAPNVHLYHTMCSVNALYGTELGTMASELRFFLVAAHEVGHVIDELAGVRFNADREVRATVYGSVIAQCYARNISRIVGDARDHPLAPADTPERERERVRAVDCLVMKYRRLESALAAIRKRVLSTGRPAHGPIAACAAPAVPNAGPAPILNKCPTSP